MSGVGGWMGMSGLIKTQPEIRITWPEELYRIYTLENTRLGICPTKGRNLMLEYLEETYKTYPEADGMSLEVYCEKPHCQCDKCQERGLWKIELDFLKEFSHRIWKWKKDAKFIWFSAEEIGLLGSKSYVKQHRKDLKKVIFMVNVDKPPEEHKSQDEVKRWLEGDPPLVKTLKLIKSWPFKEGYRV